jgi:choline/glycine/proline betaine transport protein
MIGVSALVLLLAGGMSALQTAAIVSALPFSVVILVAIWGFVRALYIDHTKPQTQLLNSGAPSGGQGSTDWKARLRNLLFFPDKPDVTEFLERTVYPAMHEFADELRRNGSDAQIEATEGSETSDTGGQISLNVMHRGEIDFQYLVVARWHPRPSEPLSEAAVGVSDGYYRAEVHLNEGSQDYDLMGWTQQQVLHDLLEQYEKHLHFLHVLR